MERRPPLHLQGILKECPVPTTSRFRLSRTFTVFLSWPTKHGRVALIRQPFDHEVHERAEAR